MTDAVKLQVTDAGDYYDATRVPLTDAQIKDQLNLLAGDGVTVSNGTNSFNGIAWPEPKWDTVQSREEQSLPLSTRIQQDLGVEPGDQVTVEPAKPSTQESSTGGVSRDIGNISDARSSRGADNNDTSDTTHDSAEEIAEVTYEDVGGLEEQLQNIRQMIELPLQRPELFTELDIDPPKGVLLHGPPGTGKTLIAKAVANETDARFLRINGPEIVSRYTGETEKRLRELFESAREGGPAIIFFDEIDSLGGERDGESDVENRLVGQLLSLMDGLGTDEDVMVLAATNRLDTLDNALRRSGRFDREIRIGIPNRDSRREILHVHLDEMPLADDVSIDTLSEQTNGFVGADIAALSREAALESLQEAVFDGNRITDYEIDTDTLTIQMQEFNSAMALVEPSALREVAATQPTADYDSVGGLTGQKQRLKEIVQWPLKYTQLFSETNTNTPTGVILHGKEGTGKTLLARAVAGETDINFLKVSGSEIFEKYVGESEEKIRELFKTAEQASPSIIFFDQIEAIANQNQGFSSNETGERVLSQLLAELDAVQNNPNITVIAATNELDGIDQRLIQPGRFEEQLELSSPEQDDREDILDIHLEGKPLADDVDISDIASATVGKTGSQIEAIVREASLLSIREYTEEYGPEKANEKASEIDITQSHFETAIDEK